MVQYQSTTRESTLPVDLQNDEQQIRQVLKNFFQAVKRGDLDEIMSFYADDVMSFDCPPPLVFHGKKEIRKSWEKYFTTQFELPIEHEIQDDHILLNQDLAVFYAVTHINGVFKETKESVESWLRQTYCFKKLNGQWLIVHDHSSVPIGTDGMGLMNLKPGDMRTH